MFTGSGAPAVELRQGGVDRLASLEQTQPSAQSHRAALDARRVFVVDENAERSHQAKFVDVRRRASSLNERRRTCTRLPISGP